jgi:predicted nucleotidyltransferase
MDISDKISDPVTVELLTHVSAVSAELGIPFFVVGAAARDMILWYGFGIRPGRATRDIDVGFSVSSWEQYDQLKKALTATGHFQPEGDKQRMAFQGRFKIDVLPFGQIVDVDKKINWRPHGDAELNLLGFDEAYENAISVLISSEPRVEVKIASAVGLVLMKIFAWDDRRPGNKDAIDLGILIRSYMQIGNEKRLYEEHDDLLESENFDYDIAGAQILGRDLARICQEETRQQVLSILDRELSEDSDLPLVVQSAASNPQIDRSLEFWHAIREELMNAQMPD